VYPSVSSGASALSTASGRGGSGAGGTGRRRGCLPCAGDIPSADPDRGVERLQVDFPLLRGVQRLQQPDLIEQQPGPAAVLGPVARSYCGRGAPRSASRFLSQIMMV
jgi:hypothetical protein